MKRLPIVIMIASVIAVAGLSGCGRDGPSTQPPAPSSPSTPGGPATPGESPSAQPTTQAPGPGTPTWTSGPTVVNRTVAVPPVPRLLGIRSAAHPEGYDRVTFDFQQTLPGYEVRYVDEVIADGSGEPVDVPGRRFLQITFRPAQAHDDSGTQSVTPRSKTLNYPMLEAYAITGDFEGVLTVVLGLDDVVGYRVGELPGQPGRIYIDVAA
jgi:hypothetical protein